MIQYNIFMRRRVTAPECLRHCQKGNTGYSDTNLSYQNQNRAAKTGYPNYPPESLRHCPKSNTGYSNTTLSCQDKKRAAKTVCPNKPPARSVKYPNNKSTIKTFVAGVFQQLFIFPVDAVPALSISRRVTARDNFA